MPHGMVAAPQTAYRHTHRDHSQHVCLTVARQILIDARRAHGYRWQQLALFSRVCRWFASTFLSNSCASRAVVESRLMVHEIRLRVGQIACQRGVNLDVRAVHADILRQHHLAEFDAVFQLQSVGGDLVLFQFHAQHVVFV